jgi:hypothetical protein
MARGSVHRLGCGGLCGLGIAATLFTAAAVHADQITSKGTVLRGKITALSSAGVTFAPEYGAGSLTVKWEDIEDLKTDASFQVLYDEGLESDAPLQGFANGTLYVGPRLEGATPIETKTITMGNPIGAEGPSWADRTRSYWRYWSGSFDLAFNYQQASTDTTGLLVGFKTIRTKDPLRLIFGANYRYGAQTIKNQTNQMTGLKEDVTTTTQDYWYGLARGEYDLTERLYTFGSGEATYDGIQRLSIRAVSKAGLGYTFWEQKLDADTRNFLSGEVGPSFVYEGYFHDSDPSHNEYFAIGFGLLAGYHLPYGAHFDGLVNYLPSVNDFTGQYFLHSEASLTMPLASIISGKFSLVDEYTKPPAGDTQSNTLFITFGLSLAWGS